nr:50S ribosomal protein L10 [Desulfuromonadales bacterium]
VEYLGETIGQSSNAFLVDFKGLDVARSTDLRIKLREKEGRLRIVKNRLAKRAFAEGALSALCRRSSRRWSARRRSPIPSVTISSASPKCCVISRRNTRLPPSRPASWTARSSARKSFRVWRICPRARS